MKLSRLQAVILLTILILLGWQPLITQAATLTVTTTSDVTAVDGLCTLREAIENANNNALTHVDCLVAGSAFVQDVIEFNIPGIGPFTIQPLVPLPPLAGDLTLDATSQPGFLPSGPRLIEINGALEGPLSSGSGFTVTGSFVHIYGFAINGFTATGGSSIDSSGIAILNGADNTIVADNYIGTDVSGTMAVGNRNGVVVRGVSALNPASMNPAAAGRRGKTAAWANRRWRRDPSSPAQNRRHAAAA